MSARIKKSGQVEFLGNSSEVTTLIRDFNWSLTTLGPIDSWPQSLRTSVSMVVHSEVPMVLLWGEDGFMIYNEAYSHFAGNRHPSLLGSKVREGWPEVAAFNDQVMQVGLSGRTLSYKDQELTLHRNGALEPAWMNLDYSPVVNESGKPAGVLAIVIETTDRILAERERRRSEHQLQLANDALYVSEQRFRAIAEAMPGFIFTATKEGSIDYISPSWSKYTGSSAEAPKGTDWAAFVHPDDVEKAFGAWRQASSQESFEVEYRLRGADGHYRWWMTRAVAVSGFDRKVERWIGACSELQQIIEARETLRRSHEELEREVTRRTQERDRVWNNSRDIMLIVTGDGIFRAVSPAWTRILGHEVEAVVDRSVLDFVHPDDADTTMRRLQQILEDVPVSGFVNRYIHKDGAPRWISWYSSTEGELLFVYGRDVTAERAQAAALAASTADRDRMWRLATDIMLIADAETTFKAINPAWTRVLGWDEQDLIGTRFIDLVHPDDLAATLAEVDTINQGQTTFRFENRYRRKDGSYCALSWMAISEHGIIFGLARDVSADREAAAAIARSEATLRQAQKMEAVGQLTGGLAHDFNNLLAGISGSLEIMQNRISQGRLTEIERYIEIAQSATRRAASLTQRLLAFSRQQTLSPKPTDANRLIRGMEDLIRRTIGPSIELEVVDAVGLWSTLIDPPQLENALLNLCINARDAMPDGGRLTIETANVWLDERAAIERELTSGQYISVCVSDTGTGMTSEVATRAFDPFFTTKPLGQGTGLGLSMVYGFARQSGGQVRIYSEPNAGTTMCLYLPRDYRTPPEDAVPEKQRDANPTGDGGIILIVDDESSIRTLVVEILQEEGYLTMDAADAPAGLRILQSETKIDLLITDVGLPGGMNGRQMADASRVLRPDLKVLFITGYAENAVIGNGHLDPGMQVITKPFAMSTLSRRVREIIENKTSSIAAAAASLRQTE